MRTAKKICMQNSLQYDGHRLQVRLALLQQLWHALSRQACTDCCLSVLVSAADRLGRSLKSYLPLHSRSDALVLWQVICWSGQDEGGAYPSDCSGWLLVEKADSVTLGAWLGRGGGSSSARSMVGQASCCTALSSGMCMGALLGSPAVQK